MKKIKPEIYHDYTSLSMQNIQEAMYTNSTVTGFVESISAEEKALNVRLGSRIIAKMPYYEATIYPLRYSKKTNTHIPTNVCCLLRQKIRVKVTNICGSTITVSRKKNMREALTKFDKMDIIPAYITGVINRTVFADCGEGIMGVIYINDICKCHIRSAFEYFQQHQSIHAAVLGVDSEGRVNLSYRQTFQAYSPDDYPVGTSIECKVGDYISDSEVPFYFVNVTPQVSGIMHCVTPLSYGQKVECHVTGATPKGLFLKLTKQM